MHKSGLGLIGCITVLMDSLRKPKGQVFLQVGAHEKEVIFVSLANISHNGLCCSLQADHPKLNFKDKYSESYRDVHPTAPVVVPWMSGVISA
jgi:hypothetical protein